MGKVMGPNWYKIDDMWHHCISVNGESFVDGEINCEYVIKDSVETKKVKEEVIETEYCRWTVDPYGKICSVDHAPQRGFQVCYFNNSAKKDAIKHCIHCGKRTKFIDFEPVEIEHYHGNIIF